MNALDMALIYFGLAMGILAALASIVCIVVLRKHRAADRKQRQLEALLRQQHEESARSIEESVTQLSRNVADLELNARNIGDADLGRLTRTRRSQAMQLLRSGMPPETAASSLGIGAREMRLIAKIARILSPQ